MTLGRSTSGAIKIKTDTAGGVRRNAVSCACCGSVCGCFNVPVTGDVLSAIRSSTTATCNGVSPNYFYKDNGGFNGEWYVPDGDIYVLASMPFDSNCFLMQASALSVLTAGGLYYGDQSCCFENFCQESSFTIQGTEYVAFEGRFFAEFPPVGPIDFIFS